jgi:hypothetical protein
VRRRPTSCSQRERWGDASFARRKVVFGVSFNQQIKINRAVWVHHPRRDNHLGGRQPDLRQRNRDSITDKTVVACLLLALQRKD